MKNIRTCSTDAYILLFFKIYLNVFPCFDFNVDLRFRFLCDLNNGLHGLHGFKFMDNYMVITC